MPLSYFLPILNHESENPKCSFFYRPVKCEISPFPPMSGTSPFPLCVCTGKALLAWPGCCGPRPALATTSRAQGLAPVSSSLRTDQKSLALLHFHSRVAADFSIPITTDDVSNWEASSRSPRLSSQPGILSCCFQFLGGRVWICPKLRRLHWLFSLSTLCPLLCVLM